MRITKLSIQNFRTFEAVDIDLDQPYTAICGPNDAGKSNVVRALRRLMSPQTEEFFFTKDESLSIADDYPKWKSADKDKSISISAHLVINKDDDKALHEFVRTQLSVDGPPADMHICITTKQNEQQSEPDFETDYDGTVHTGLKAEEIINKIRSTRCILVHNSTETPVIRFRGGLDALRELSEANKAQVTAIQETASKKLRKIIKDQQQSFSSLLGRLGNKYEVGLSLPALDFSHIPLSISLSQSKHDISLDEWGSGTRNRTLILMMLFRAKEVRSARASASKTTPIIVIEEPESFLHPSAQAEFGRVLQDLAGEFKIQGKRPTVSD